MADAIVTKAMRDALDALSPRQRAFAIALKEGKDPGVAYQLAYDPRHTGRGDRYDEKQWQNRGFKMQKNPKIIAYLQAFRTTIERSSIKTAIETCEWLSALIDNDKEKTKDRLRAVELLARIRGWFQDPPTVVLNPQGEGGHAQAVINIIGVDNANAEREASGENNQAVIHS